MASDEAVGDPQRKRLVLFCIAMPCLLQYYKKSCCAWFLSVWVSYISQKHCIIWALNVEQVRWSSLAFLCRLPFRSEAFPSPLLDECSWDTVVCIWLRPSCPWLWDWANRIWDWSWLCLFIKLVSNIPKCSTSSQVTPSADCCCLNCQREQ